MASSVQTEPSYTYTPGAAQSTRQILDDSSPSTKSTSTEASAAPSNTLPERPRIVQRRTSNYATAAAAASSSTSAPSTTSEQGDSTSGTESRKGSVGWRPRMDRQQSWKLEDMKHERQKSVVGTASGPGYSAKEQLAVKEEKASTEGGVDEK